MSGVSGESSDRTTPLREVPRCLYARVEIGQGVCEKGSDGRMTSEQAKWRLERERGAFTMREWYRWRYLKSDHWKQLRARKLRQNPDCQRCGRPAIQVHHIRYKNIFDVMMEDLESICVECHGGEHKRKTSTPYHEVVALRSKNLHIAKAKRGDYRFNCIPRELQ